MLRCLKLAAYKLLLEEGNRDGMGTATRLDCPYNAYMYEASTWTAAIGGTVQLS